MSLRKSSKTIRNTVMKFALVFVLLFGSVANAATFVDVGQDHWANEQIQEWADKGFIKGYEDGSFKPNGVVTRAELMSLVNASFAFEQGQDVSVMDVQVGAWYEDAVKTAISAGYIHVFEDGAIRPNEKVSRQDAAIIVAEIAGLVGNEAAASVYTDEISHESKAAIGAITERGYMSGYPDGTFGATKWITRAEVITVLNRALKDRAAAEIAIWTIDEVGTYGPLEEIQTVAGDVNITVAGVTLQNMVIEGDLVIAESVGEGDVFLTGVTVKGDTLVHGGGENSIHVEDSIFVHVIVDKENGKIRIVIRGASHIERLSIQTDTKLEVGDDASISETIMNAIVNVIGEGSIAKATIHVSGVTFDKLPSLLETADGIEAPKVTPVTPPVTQPVSNEDNPPSDSNGNDDYEDSTPVIIPNVSIVTESSYVYIGDEITVSSDQAGTVYLVPAGTVKNMTVLNELTTTGAGVQVTVAANEEVNLDTTELEQGQYIVYGSDAVGNLSNASRTMNILPEGYVAISSAEQLAAIGEDEISLSHDYMLISDIDLAGFDWEPIGIYEEYDEIEIPFNGQFDGNGYVISNLTYANDERVLAGLFAVTSAESVLTNIKLVNVSITGAFCVGGLVGANQGTITHSSVQGSVTGAEAVGGLVGCTSDVSSVESSTFQGEVTGENTIGGLVGSNYGLIESSTADANVTGENTIGGLVGDNDGLVEESSSAGIIEGNDGVGGLVGSNDETIRSSHSTAIVIGIKYFDEEEEEEYDAGAIGGLVGGNYGSIESSSASGYVVGVYNVGGLVGYNSGGIMASMANGDVVGKENVGGLVGANFGMVMSSTAYGDVAGEQYVGGLAGVVRYGGKTIADSYALNNQISRISGSISEDFGRIVGNNDGSILLNNYAYEDMEAPFEDAFGDVGPNGKDGEGISLEDAEEALTLED